MPFKPGAGSSVTTQLRCCWYRLPAHGRDIYIYVCGSSGLLYMYALFCFCFPFGPSRRETFGSSMRASPWAGMCQCKHICAAHLACYVYALFFYLSRLVPQREPLRHFFCDVWLLPDDLSGLGGAFFLI